MAIVAMQGQRQQPQQQENYEHFQEVGLNQLNAGRLGEAEQSFLHCLKVWLFRAVR